MKTAQIVTLVGGASLLTFILSVVFSINMASISPENLAKVIKKDPEAFINAIKEASESHQKQQAEKDMEAQFKSPADIPTEGRVTFGKADAPIAVVEYSDFQCGFCAKAAGRMRAIRKKYKGQVKVVYKHFPLSFHPFAKPAAEYFEAVALIGHDHAKKFHDTIFDNFGDYARLKDKKEITKKLNSLIKELGLSKQTVESHLKKAKEVVQNDLAEAGRLNVGGTPSFFVNGIDTKGRVESVINKLMEKL